MNTLMRTSLLLPLLPLAWVVAAQAQPKPAPKPMPPKGFKLYQGPWFNVFYPTGWKATQAPLSKANPDDRTSDGAFFTSPDQKARFYIYSPIWNGTPKDALPQKGESVASRDVKISSDTLKSQIVTTWTTIRGPKNAYTRSMVDVENRTLNTRRTHAFQYRDAVTYRKYLPLYTTFKNSLQQFSD